MSKEAIQEIRRNGEGFLKSLNEALYQNLSGSSRDADTSAAYTSYSVLSESDLFLTLKKTSPEADEDTRSRQLLLSFLARTFLGSKNAAVTDAILELESKEEFILDQKTVLYRQSYAGLKKEQKRSKREEMDRKRRDVVSKLNPFYIRQLATVHDYSERLGYPGYTALCDEMENLNLNRLQEQAKQFLNDTDYMYKDLLAWFLIKRTETRLKDAKSYDLAYLMNSFELKGNFPKTDLKTLTKIFLDEMGIQVKTNIRPDTERRKGKVAEPFCLPIDAPRNVVFSLYPIGGGIEDYESYLYGLGSSLPYGYADPGHYFEWRCLREAASVEIFANLFKNLVYQPDWIKRYLRSEITNDFLKFLYLRYLMKVRLLSGKLIYELALHKDEEFKDKAAFYKEMLSTATLCESTEDDYLVDVKPFFYTASCLKAAIIEAGLRASLKERFDEEWWRVRDAGEFLRKMWLEGGYVTSAEISKKSGFEELDLSPLMRFFEEVFI